MSAPPAHNASGDARPPAVTPGRGEILPAQLKAVDELIGRTLGGRYRLLELIGEGTFSAVFAGWCRQRRKRVAIKVLVPALVADSTGLSCTNLLDRFELEARVALHLRHPNAIETLDFGRLDQLAYLVMELLDGETLMSRIERVGASSPTVAIDYAWQICGALGAAHAAGLVHRDLKPHNLMVVRRSDGERVKVLDFGTVKVTDAGWSAGKLTADGTILGTAWYMSPEQARGDAIDHRSDLYSLSVVLFELLTGVLPFDSRHAAKVMLAHVSRPAPRLDSVRPSFAAFPALIELVDRGLAKAPADRFQDAAAFRAALVRARAEVEARPA